jgi:beta-N-acetylhexosaminidase
MGPLLPEGPHPDRQIETLSRKIGQMLLIGFVGITPDDPEATRAAGMIAAGRLGGVILFADNVVGPKQLRRLTAALRAAGGRIPPFIAVDQEGGSIQRLTRRKGFQPLPSARTMARKTPCEAETLYLRTAEELATFDINLNFGPVVDLDINPRNPAIGRLSRSYGIDPAKVVAYARAFIAAHDAAGVLTAAKHFPGHGSAVFDPHIAIVDIGEVWQPQELAPFATLAGEVPMIMVGHLIHPRFSDGDRPTSLSRRAITDELRDRLGFEGVVVTDDLGMDAITERYRPEQAAEMAIRAGADLLIFAHAESQGAGSIERIIAAVAGAVAAGRLPVSRIEGSHTRLLAARTALAEGAADPARHGASACSDARLAEPGRS